MSAQPRRAPRISPPPRADPNGPIPKAPSSTAASVHAHRDTHTRICRGAGASRSLSRRLPQSGSWAPFRRLSATTAISLKRRETRRDITVPVPPKIPTRTQVVDPPAAPRPADDLRNATKPPQSPPAKSRRTVGFLTLPRPRRPVTRSQSKKNESREPEPEPEPESELESGPNVGKGPVRSKA